MERGGARKTWAAQLHGDVSLATCPPWANGGAISLFRRTNQQTLPATDVDSIEHRASFLHFDHTKDTEQSRWTYIHERHSEGERGQGQRQHAKRKRDNSRLTTQGPSNPFASRESSAKSKSHKVKIVTSIVYGVCSRSGQICELAVGTERADERSASIQPFDQAYKPR